MKVGGRGGSWEVEEESRKSYEKRRIVVEVDEFVKIGEVAEGVEGVEVVEVVEVVVCCCC